MRALIRRAHVALGNATHWLIKPVLHARWEAEGNAFEGLEEQASRSGINRQRLQRAKDRACIPQGSWWGQMSRAAQSDVTPRWAVLAGVAKAPAGFAFGSEDLHYHSDRAGRCRRGR